MYCRFCGKQIGDEDKFCPYCGGAQEFPAGAGGAQGASAPFGGAGGQEAPPLQGGGQNGSGYGGYPYPPVADSGSVGWGVLGFFVPLVGLILFLVWHDEKPRCSKKAGIGALIGVIVWFFLGVVLGTVAVIVLPDIVGQYAAAALSFPL